MNGILGMAELLLDTPLSRTQRDYAGVIFQSGEALMEIINGILDFSRLEAGRTQLALSAVPIRATLEQVVELMSATARTKHILLRCAVEPDCPEVIQADAGRLRQVLLNLVGNAVKFTEAGKVDVRAFRAAPGRVRVEIADLRTELKGDIAELRTELKSDIAELRGEMTTLGSDLRGEMTTLEQRLIDRINTAQRWNIATMIAPAPA